MSGPRTHRLRSASTLHPHPPLGLLGRPRPGRPAARSLRASRASMGWPFSRMTTSAGRFKRLHLLALLVRQLEVGLGDGHGDADALGRHRPLGGRLQRQGAQRLALGVEAKLVELGLRLHGQPLAAALAHRPPRQARAARIRCWPAGARAPSPGSRPAAPGRCPGIPPARPAPGAPSSSASWPARWGAPTFPSMRPFGLEQAGHRPHGVVQPREDARDPATARPGGRSGGWPAPAGRAGARAATGRRGPAAPAPADRRWPSRCGPPASAGASWYSKRRPARPAEGPAPQAGLVGAAPAPAPSGSASVPRAVTWACTRARNSGRSAPRGPRHRPTGSPTRCSRIGPTRASHLQRRARSARPCPSDQLGQRGAHVGVQLGQRLPGLLQAQAGRRCPSGAGCWPSGRAAGRPGDRPGPRPGRPSAPPRRPGSRPRARRSALARPPSLRPGGRRPGRQPSEVQPRRPDEVALDRACPAAAGRPAAAARAAARRSSPATSSAASPRARCAPRSASAQVACG